MAMTETTPPAILEPRKGSPAYKALHFRWSGLLVAVGYFGLFAASTYFALFRHEIDFDPASLAISGSLVLVLIHLYTALFITAHDAMHGTVLPGSTTVNAVVGTICLVFYAGFDFDTVRKEHRRYGF